MFDKKKGRHIFIYRETEKDMFFGFRQKDIKNIIFFLGRATKGHVLKDRGVESLCLKRNRTKNMNDHELTTNYS